MGNNTRKHPITGIEMKIRVGISRTREIVVYYEDGLEESIGGFLFP